MDIGKVIYFDISTGDVIFIRGERRYQVIETTKDDDFNSYSDLIGKDPSTIDFIQLAYGERELEFQNMGSCHVDPTTKVLTIIPKA